MNATLIAVVLSVAQALAPVPGQTPNDAARGGKDSTEATTPNQNPPTQSEAAGEPKNSPEPQNPSGNVGATNTEQTISVRELPPVTVTINGPWTDGLFNLLLILVGVGQGVLLYYTLKAINRQADIANKQAGISEQQLALTQPRIHIEGIRHVNFTGGSYPIFFVKVGNSGIIAATNVTLSMSVSLADSTASYINKQVMTIPAREGRECFIRARKQLTFAMLKELDEGTAHLRITGTVTCGDQQIDYCYKYNPWRATEPRPVDFPLLVPCDFDTSMDIAMTLEPGAFVTFGATLDTEVTKAPPEPSKETI